MQLLRIERTIAKYKNSDEHIVDEFNIDIIPLNNLLEIVTPKEDDPLLYDGYVLSEFQFEQINSLLEVKITPDFRLFYYVLECAEIYE